MITKIPIDYRRYGDTINIVIPGVPIPKARPRFYIRNGKQFAYDPQNQEKNAIRASVENCAVMDMFHGNFCSTQNNYKMLFEFQMPWSSVATTSDKKLFEWGIQMSAHKPDVDNMVKFYCDVLNEIIYPDDSQVIDIHAIKTFSQNPKTIIDIMAIRPKKLDDTTGEILAMISPNDFKDLANDTNAIANMDMFPGSETPHDEIALAISNFSTKYSAILTKIAKKQIKNGESHDPAIKL